MCMHVCVCAHCIFVVYMVVVCACMWVHVRVEFVCVCEYVCEWGMCVCLCVCACVFTCVCGMCMPALNISEMRLSALGHNSGLLSFLSFRLIADGHL